MKKEYNIRRFLDFVMRDKVGEFIPDAHDW